MFAQERSRPELDARYDGRLVLPQLAPGFYRVLTVFHALALVLLLGAFSAMYEGA